MSSYWLDINRWQGKTLSLPPSDKRVHSLSVQEHLCEVEQERDVMNAYGEDCSPSWYPATSWRIHPCCVTSGMATLALPPTEHCVSLSAARFHHRLSSEAGHCSVHAVPGRSRGRELGGSSLAWEQRAAACCPWEGALLAYGLLPGEAAFPCSSNCLPWAVLSSMVLWLITHLFAFCKKAV